MLACQQWLCGFRQVSRLVSAHSRTSLCSIFNVPAMCTCAIIGVPFVCHATSTGTLGFLFPPPAGQYAKLHASSSVSCVFCSSTKETAVCGQHYLHWDLIATDTHFEHAESSGLGTYCISLFECLGALCSCLATRRNAGHHRIGMLCTGWVGLV